jgi:hypothetical protein
VDNDARQFSEQLRSHSADPICLGQNSVFHSQVLRQHGLQNGLIHANPHAGAHAGIGQAAEQLKPLLPLYSIGSITHLAAKKMAKSATPPQ